MTGAPTGAEFVSQLDLRVRAPDPDTNIPPWILARDVVAGAAAAVKLVTWDGFVLVPPKWRIGGSINYSAGALAKASSLTIHGFWLPDSALK